MFKNKSLGSIAAEVPMSTAIFRKYNLDFCCGGKKSLKDACAEKGLPLETISEELKEISGNSSQLNFDIHARGITTYIEGRYHQDLRTRLPELIKLAEKVETAHEGSPDLPIALSKYLKEFTTEMFDHMKKEEEVLFPLINRGETKLIQIPISCMENEHAHHGESLKRFRMMTNDFKAPSQACPTWKALYRGLLELESEVMDHINLENNILFPRAFNSLVP